MYAACIVGLLAASSASVTVPNATAGSLVALSAVSLATLPKEPAEPAPELNLLRGLPCFMCEFLVDGDSAISDGVELSPTGVFELTLPTSRQVSSVVAFCVPLEEDAATLHVVVTDEQELETTMAVPASALEGAGELRRIVVPVRRDVRRLRIETNTLLTELEAYPEYRSTVMLPGATRPRSPNPFATFGLEMGRMFGVFCGLALFVLVLPLVYGWAPARPRGPVGRLCDLDAWWLGRRHGKLEEEEEREEGPGTGSAPPPLVRGESLEAGESAGPVPQLMPPPIRSVRLPRPPSCMRPQRPACLPSARAGGPPTVQYLFASPLVRTTTGDAIVIPRLDVDGEARALRQLAQEARQPVAVEYVVATSDNIVKALTSTAELCLHITSHGTDGGLVLEDGVGRMHLLSLDLLRKTAEAHQPLRPRLIFLNSCNSFELGHVFFNAGAGSVVCTKQGCAVLDADAKYFTQHFYSALFAGRSIQEAFGLAQTALLSRAGAVVGESFLLLSHGSSLKPFFGASVSDEESPGTEGDDGGPSSDDSGDSTPPKQVTMKLAHTLRSRMQRPAAQRNSGNGAQTTPVPAPSGDFLARDMDIFAVLQSLMRRRFVVLCGGPGTRPGIGKTAVAEEVVRWSARRKAHAGAYLVDTQFTVHDAWAVIHAVIRGGPQRKAGTRSAFEACAAELRRQGNVLLVLDQADGVLSQPAFQADLHKLLERVPSLHLVAVAHEPVILPGRYKAITHPLKRLSATDATELFLRRIGRALTRADFMDFPEDREPLDKASAMTALLRHPIQRLMDGHPRTISELAAKVTPALPSLLDLTAPAAPEAERAPRAREVFKPLDTGDVARLC